MGHTHFKDGETESQRLGYMELSSRAGIRHLVSCDTRAYAMQPPSPPHLLGGTLSHIKLTGLFLMSPVSVLLVWMKMPSCSGSWLSRCFTTLVFFQLPCTC